MTLKIRQFFLFTSFLSLLLIGTVSYALTPGLSSSYEKKLTQLFEVRYKPSKEMLGFKFKAEVKLMNDLYKNYVTESELDQLIQFYSSPVYLKSSEVFTILVWGGVNKKNNQGKKNFITKSFKNKINRLVTLRFKASLATRIKKNLKGKKDLSRGYYELFQDRFSDQELDMLILFYSSIPAQKDKKVTPQLMMALSKLDLSRQLPKDNCLSNRSQVISSIVGGLKMLKEARGTAPQFLDQASDGNASQSNVFFTKVLNQGISDSNWSKRGNAYTHECKSNHARYFFNDQKGLFKKL